LIPTNEQIITDNQTIQNKIYTIRGVQVMIDKDLAQLYDLKPTRLSEQVRRNIAFQKILCLN